jgi:hypothetical protein
MLSCYIIIIMWHCYSYSNLCEHNYQIIVIMFKNYPGTLQFIQSDSPTIISSELIHLIMNLFKFCFLEFLKPNKMGILFWVLNVK